MLQHVDLAPHPIDRYVPVLGLDEIDRLRELAAPLRGLRVGHINATGYGGGVSELLHSLVPFYRALGIDAEWRIIPGDDDFFKVTKGFHNALQGADFDLTQEVKDTYLSQNQKFAELVDDDYDLVMVHDPQPAAIRSLHGHGQAKWVWRIWSANSFAMSFIRDLHTNRVQQKTWRESLESVTTTREG